MFESPIIPCSKSCQINLPGLGSFNGITVLDEKTKQEKCHRFTGIRFAKPPIGSLRWRKPVPLEDGYDYSGDYTKFRTICPQPFYRNRGKQMPNPDFHYDEDCLFLNIWVPPGDAPSGGWPVMYYIHGGFLQVGNPLHYRHCDPQDLQAQGSPARFILVSPGHRLNLFGFLSGKELLHEDPENSNFGFWDQRLGLEWTAQNIESFGGNRENIIIGGISAGSYSAIFQLAYEVDHPEVDQIIKRVILMSNGLAVQPKFINEAQDQFDELASAFDIPKGIDGGEKLRLMRAIPYQDLASKILDLHLHTFRAVTDRNFVSATLFEDIYTGKFGQKVKESGRSFVIGEVINEHSIYANTNPPSDKEDLLNQLNNYYPSNVAKALLELYPKVKDSADEEKRKAQLKFLFGRIVSDMQVYVSSRVFINGLLKGGVTPEKIYRYRIAFRGKFVDKYFPPEEFVPHAGDLGIWFYNRVDGILPEEEPYYLAWLKPYGEWIRTGKADWGTTDPHQLRMFNSDGSISVTEDDLWSWSIKVGNTVSEALGIS